MATHVYYPRERLIVDRAVSGSTMQQLIIDVQPETIFYMDNTSSLSALTASVVSVASASWAITASFAMNGGGGSGTSLGTGSTYPITSSWAVNATSASYAPGAAGGTTLNTGSLYPITASWALTGSSYSGQFINFTSASVTRWQLYYDVSADTLDFRYAVVT